MTARLGVDLGTTWTAAAVEDSGSVTAVTLGSAGAAMPSVVAIVDGKPVAGDAAVRAGRDAPSFVAREFKRRLGDSTPIVLGTTPYGPEALTGHLLAHVIATAGGERQVAIAHPATWGEFKLDLLREAGRVAGLDEIELVPEPIAAAGHYARLGRLSTGDAVAVYDFGGGTFDAAVVRLGPDGPELLGRAEGLDRLGGVDLDQAVLAHVDNAMDGALRAMNRDDPAVRRAAVELRAECVAAKEALSADTETTIAVRFPALTTDVRMTRAEFETAVRPRVAETLNMLDRTIASASLTAGDLAGIVLVGGSSRIPLVAEQVAAHTGRPNLLDADPKLAVAFGAGEPHLRPQSTSRPQPVPATATMEAAMTDSTRSTPNPPPPPGEGSPKGDGGPAGGRPAAPRTAPPRPPERRTTAANAPKEKTGMSTGGKVAAGVAAAGAATAAGLLWGDQVTDALGITGDDVDEDTADDAAATDESLDAFDAVAPSGGGGGGGGGGFSGGGGGAAFAPPRPQARPRAQEPDLPPPSAGGTQAPPVDPALMAAKAQLQERLENWQPPEGADPAEAAELRDRLDGLLDRYQPRPGQSTDDAIAELRDEFTLRIDQYTQDLRLDAHDEARAQEEAVDAQFDQRRAELQERLDNWTPPEGADPEQAAAFKAELEAMVDRAQPIPGQTADEAFADVQQRFDGMVNDFVTEQKVDALEEEERREEEAEDTDVDPTIPFIPGTGIIPDELLDRLDDWAPEGLRPADVARIRAEIRQAAEDRRSFDELAPQTREFAQGLYTAGVVQTAVDPRVTTTADDLTANTADTADNAEASTDAILVDDFDAMVGNTGVAEPDEPSDEPDVMTAPAPEPEPEVAAETPAMADAGADDVVGEDLVADAIATGAEDEAFEPAVVDEPEPIGVMTAPAFDTTDDLGLDLDLGLETIDAEPEITFDEPVEADFADIAETEAELTDLIAADASADDLST